MPPKKYHPDVMAAIQEVTFYILLAYEYNELTNKSNAYVICRMCRTNTTTSLFFQTILKIMKVIYILNSYILYRRNVCTKLLLKISTSMALLIKHSLNTILLGYLFETKCLSKF